MIWNAFHQRCRAIVRCHIHLLTVTTLDNGYLARPDTPLEAFQNICVKMTGAARGGHQVSAEHNVTCQQSTFWCRKTELIFIIQ